MLKDSMKKFYMAFGRILDKDETCSAHRNMFILCIIGIIVINWISNYYYFHDFSLYSDDYVRIPRMMQAMREGNRAVGSVIFMSPLNVRPLHGDLIHAISFVGLKLGGIPGIYLLGFLILSINSTLAFLLLMRITGNFVCSFIGALALILYPVTTVKVWLTAALGIQPALTLLLFSFIFYVHDRKVLSYILAATSLFLYETFFWVFISAPLLVGRWSRKLFSRMVLHVAILSPIFFTFFIFKFMDSDPRIKRYSIKDLFHTAFKHVIEGPCTNLVGNIKVPIKTLIGLNSMDFFLGATCAAGLFWLLYKLSSVETEYPLNGGGFKDDRTANGATTSLTISNISRVSLVGLIMLIFSYPLTFTSSVRDIYDTGSRLHLAGAIGISLIYAGMSGLVILFLSYVKKRKIGIAILSVWLSLLIVYNVGVQKDYRHARDIQRKFWTKLIMLCPDITDETLVFVNSEGLQKVRSISPLDWSTIFIFEDLYELPTSWSKPPRIFMLGKSQWDNLINSNNKITLGDLNIKDKVLVFRYDKGRKIEATNSIFLYYKNGLLRRLKRRVDLYDKKIHEHMPGFQLNDLKKGVLYNYLVNE